MATTKEAVDFAVCGSTPFACLVAGLLGTVHGRRVCLVGDDWSPYQLIRGFDVSVMPATRPETWMMLKRGSAETLKLLGGIGKGLYERVDPLFVGETRASADALGHMRWVALGLGIAAERVVDRAIIENGSICRIRDAAMLVHGKAEPALFAWLDKEAVPRLPAAETGIALRRDGGATLTAGKQILDAAHIVLADDSAILARLPANDRHAAIRVSDFSSVLTEPAAPLAAAMIHYLDRQVDLCQRATKGPISILGGGPTENVLARIGASLAAQGRLKRAGQAVFRSISTADGAPIVGRTRTFKATVIAGLGASAAFLAPAIARFLAGAASEDEQIYMGARQPSKAAIRHAVAEYSRLPEVETQT